MTLPTVENRPRFQVPTRRLGIAIFLIVATQGGLLAASFLLYPSSVRPARGTLQTLPMTIDAWTGVDVDIDERILGALGATELLGREYSRADGSRVSVHVASWRDASEWTPHPPELCYSNSGWTMLNRSRDNAFDDTQSVAEQQGHQKDIQRVSVTYWFQIGPIAYVDRDGARVARKQYFGHTTRPPLYKVMLQTSGADGDAHRAAVNELAREIKTWIARQ